MNVQTEYDVLSRVLMCEASSITEQYSALQNLLTQQGVNIVQMPHTPGLEAQEFTRDVGFVIGHVLFSGHLSRQHRKAETKAFQQYLEQHHLAFVPLTNPIEGGDVLVHGPYVFVGLGSRTTEAGVNELRRHLGPAYHVFGFPYDGSRFLHLDSLFNIISPTQALCYQAAFQPSSLQTLQSLFSQIYPVTSSTEQANLALNVLNLGNKTMIMPAGNPQTARMLRNHGFTVLETNLQEFVSARGGPRCLTLPLLRTTTRTGSRSIPRMTESSYENVTWLIIMAVFVIMAARVLRI